MTRLLLVPLDDAVVFPGMSVTLAVDTADEERVLLVPRHDNDFANVGIGTVAEVRDTVRLPGGAHAVMIEGLHRGVAGAAVTEPNGRLYVDVEERPDPVGEVPSRELRELEREYRAVVEEILDLMGADNRIQSFLRGITEPGALADSTGYSPDLNYEQRIELLQQVDILTRLQMALTFQRERLAELQVRKRIRDDVESGAEKQQREYFLRKQMDSIRRELGEDDASVFEEYRTKIDEAEMPDEVREQAEKELGRLERVGEQSGESSVIRTYLDWLLAVPWGKRSEERLDPEHAREVLDHDHAGLDDVKDRIVEFIAVKKLRQERGITDGRRSGAILTLIGPPGTGKTSIGESIARATGREFIRISLGGGARRGRDPRPPPHLHRCVAGPARARAARRGHDEPGDHARRGRQGRRRLARGPRLGSARGARPGAEPRLPRPLPRRRGRPQRRDVHRHRQRHRHDPGGRCWTAWR